MMNKFISKKLFLTLIITTVMAAPTANAKNSVKDFLKNNPRTIVYALGIAALTVNGIDLFVEGYKSEEKREVIKKAFANWRTLWKKESHKFISDQFNKGKVHARLTAQVGAIAIGVTLITAIGICEAICYVVRKARENKDLEDRLRKKEEELKEKEKQIDEDELVKREVKLKKEWAELEKQKKELKDNKKKAEAWFEEERKKIDLLKKETEEDGEEEEEGEHYSDDEGNDDEEIPPPPLPFLEELLQEVKKRSSKKQTPRIPSRENRGKKKE